MKVLTIMSGSEMLMIASERVGKCYADAKVEREREMKHSSKRAFRILKNRLFGSENHYGFGTRPF